MAVNKDFLVKNGLDVGSDIKVDGTTVIDSGAEIVTAQLKDSGVTADTYGSASEVPVLTIDAKGRVTAATTTNVAGVSTFTYDSVNETLTITTADGGSFSVDVSSLASESFVNTIVSNLVDSAPTTLDTLNELAAAINDDANFAATVTTALGTKVDKIDITGATVGSSTAIPVITYNTQGQITSATETGITVGDGQFTVTAGSGLADGGVLGTANQTGNTSVTISHADTSTQASVDNSGNTFIQDITLDDFGHITAIGSGTVTVGDATITIDAGTDLVTGGDFTTNQGTNETITLDHASITRTDTTSSQTATHSGTVDVVDGITTSATGHVTAVNVKTVTLPAQYVHPTHAGDDINLDTGALSGGTVISDLDFNITTDTSGHVTDANATYSTKNLDDRYYTETESDSRFVNVTGDTMTGNLSVSIPDNGSAPATTALFNLRGYEGRGAGITIQDSANSASGSTNREWFIGSGYSQSGFNIGYASDGVQSSYVAQNKLSIDTSGNAIFAGTINANGNQRVFADNYHPNADKWTTARTLSLTGAVTGSASIDGSGNVSLATTATSDPTLTITGDVTGSATFTNLGNATLSATVADNSHNHTSLTGVTSIGFAAEASDSASISTTISGTNTYFDFNLSDDNSQDDQWRWRFTPSGSTVYNAMVLDPVSNGNANLTVSGTVTADSFVGNASSATIAGDADTVDSIHASQFLRSDADDTATGNLTFTGVTTFNNDINWNPNGYQFVMNSDGTRDTLEWQRNGTKLWNIQHNASGQLDIQPFNGQSNGVLINGSRIITIADKGVANGVAELDATGKVPSAQLPSYVDDVLEYAAFANFPATGEVGKLYVALDSNDVYRWTGSAYVKVSDAVSSSDQATKLATARTISLSGDVTGSTSFDGSSNVTISATVANDSHSHSNYLPLSGGTMTGNIMMNDEYIDFKTSGNPALPQIRGYRGSTDLNTRLLESEGGLAWTTYDSGTTNKPSGTTNNANGVLSLNTHGGSYGHQLAFTNSGGFWHRSEENGSIRSWDRVFTDNYHPNADKWTTARTLSLTGDVTGSVSWDGSGNASINATVADDSHSHSNYVLNTGDTITGRTYIDSTFNDKFFLRGSNSPSIEFQNDEDTFRGRVGVSELNKEMRLVGQDPEDVQGVHILGLGQNGLRYSPNNGGTQYKVWHAGNDGSGSGLDADTVDGLHASDFASASHTHSYLPLTGGTLTGNLNITSATIGMGNDTAILYFNDANNVTKTDYWSGKDGFEIRGDSNNKANVVLQTGNLELTDNGYINGKLGVTNTVEAGAFKTSSWTMNQDANGDLVFSYA